MTNKEVAEFVPDTVEPVINPRTAPSNITHPLQSQAGTTQVVTQIPPGVIEGISYGPSEERLDDSIQTPSDIWEIQNHLRKIRTEKESLMILDDKSETLKEIIERINTEVLEVQSVLEGASTNQNNTIQYALMGSGEDVPSAEKERLMNLSVLENKDAAILDGLDFGVALRSVQGKLNSLQSGATYSKMLDFTEKSRGTGISELLTRTGTKSMLEKLRLNCDAGTLSCAAGTQKEPTEAADYLEVYCPVPKIQYNQQEFIQRYVKLDERLTKIEELVGIASFRNGNLPFTDVISALSQITERLLFLDPKKAEAISEKALEISASLDRVSASKSAKVKHFATGTGEDGQLQATTSSSEQHIEFLYDILGKWENSIHLLPRVVKKMKLVACLARDASNLTHRVTELDEEMNRMEQIVNSAETTLASVNDKLSEHIALMARVAERFGVAEE